MKTVNYILLFLSLFPFSLSAQIYVSQIYESKLMIGPDNVTLYAESLVDEYLAESKAWATMLEEAIAANEAEQMAVLARGKLRKKKNKKAFQALKAQQDLLTYELEVIHWFTEIWSDNQGNDALALKFLSDWKENPCQEIVTNCGVYSPHEYDVMPLEAEDQITYDEVIFVEYLPERKEWVKKKRAGCFSSDPDNCLVWCLMEQSEGMAFNDFQGKRQVIETCPEGFKFEEKLCYHEKQLAVSDKTIVHLYRKKDDKTLKIIEWRAVECKEKPTVQSETLKID